MLIGLSLTFAFGSCHIYKSYERPEGVSASDSLYRRQTATQHHWLRCRGKNCLPTRCFSNILIRD